MGNIAPLSGKRVLVTRAGEQAGPLSALLREQGAEPVEVAVLEIVPPESWEELDAAIRRLPEYDWLVFTSANAVRAFLDRACALNTSLLNGERSNVAAVGPATARELRRLGVKVDFVPSDQVVEEVAAGLTARGVRGKRVLFPRGNIARDVLRVELERAGAMVDAPISYRTLPATANLEPLKAELAAGTIDVATFGSPSAIRYLMQGLGPEAASLLSHAVIACIGPTTADAAHDLGLRVDVVAAEHTISGLVQAIVRYFGRS